MNVQQQILWVELRPPQSPQKHMFKSYPLGPVNVISLETESLQISTSLGKVLLD